MSKNVVDMTLRANMDLSQVSSGLNQMQSILKQLKLSPNLKKEFDSLFTDAANQLEKYQSKLESGFKTKGDITGFDKIAQGLEKSLSKIDAAWTKLQGKDLSNLVKLDNSSIARVQEIENSFKTLGQELKTNVATQLKDVAAKIQLLNTSTSKKAGVSIAEMLGAGQYREALALLDQYIAKQEKVKGRGGKYETTYNNYDAIRTSLLGVIAELDKYDQGINRLNTEKLDIMASATEKTSQKLQQGANVLTNLTQKTHEYSKAIKESATKTVELGNDLDMLKSRVQYFFSLTNSVMLFRRILQDTIQTTKELDAAMTETAVVTDFSVSDMWKELPRYTKLAKELGATIQGVYETMTLYYQQGLKTNEVFEVGTETLKMARVAGLDYAKATDFMTAALRGFNMEVNELNAQKVNDVYSELAAITAADTKEIATAMTKTASIASNANMEFETTAAFLSQIIETTRESAETAGTAMKTVIARFTELKKDPAEIGEVDGEIVDANKIETALRTIDVALRGTNGQFRDLDDVFLDIAAKWDGLSTNTQRYIATMAAGSRQQSRFIAMMSDYSRTMELVNAANNSAGASQRQFDKTLESLEAKLNQLKDAWDQFTMGIANNTLIKGGIDALTGLLNIINKLTEHLPGATKGIANLLLMIGGFAAGKKVMDAFFASTVTNITTLAKGGDKAGEAYGVSFREALTAEFGKTRKTLSKVLDKKTWINSGDLFSNSFEAVNKELTDIANDAAEAFYSVEEGFDDTLEASAYNKALAERNMLMKAATKDQQAYIVLRQAGLPIETAQLALKKELTEEDWEELAVQSLLIGTDKTRDGLTKKEIQDRLILLKTQQAELAADKMGILTKAKYYAMLIFGNAERKKEAITRLRAAGATWAQKAATDAATVSLAHNIALTNTIIAAIAAFILVLTVLVNVAKKLSLDYKLEKAAEATEKAKEAANQAKKAYDELNSSIEELKSAEQNIDNLTQGTLEWQQAVLELNKQILELIDQFPELRSQLLNELQVEANGKLTLSDTGYNLIKQQSNERYKNAIAGQSISATQEAFLRKEKKLQDFNQYSALVYKTDETGKKQEAATSQKVAGIVMATEAQKAQQAYQQSLTPLLQTLVFGSDEVANTVKQQLKTQAEAQQMITSDYALTSISAEDKDKLYTKYLNDPKLFVEGNTELNKFATELGIASDSLLEFVPAMRQRREAELEYEASVRAQAQQLILGTTSDTFQNRKDSSGISSTFASFFADKQDSLISQEASVISGKGNDLTEYAKQLGIQNFVNQGTTTKSLEKLYQELTGSTKEQVEEMFGGNEKELRNAIARIKVGKDWGKKVESFAKELDTFGRNLSDIDKKALTDLFGGANGSGFTKGSLDQFKNYNDEQLARVYHSSKTLQGQFDSKDSFVEWAREQVSQAELVFSDAKTKLSSLGISIDSFNEKLSADAIDGISNKLEEVFYNGGDSSKLAEQFNEIVGTLEPEKANQFASALNAIDWSSVTDLEGLSNTLYEMGIYVDKTKLDTFTDNIIDFNDATRKVDLGQLTTQLENAQSLIEDISDRERGEREFTKEEMELLTSGEYGVSSDLFVGYGDKWQYVGTSLDALTQALQKNTEATLRATVADLDKQIEIANKATTAQENGVDLSGYGTLSSEQRQELLGNFLNTLGEAETFGGYNVDKLRGLAEAKDLDSAQQDFLNGFLEILANAIGTEDSLVAQKESTERGLGFLQYAGKSSTEIASTATQTETTENATEIKNATDALLYKAAAYDELDDEIRAYNDAVKSNNKEQEKAIKKDIAAKVAIEERAEALDDLDDKVEDHIKGLKKTNKGTDEYKEGLADLTEDLNAAFDTDLTSSFFEDTPENLTLLERALEGSQSAWNSLILKIQEAQLQTIDFENEYNISANNIATITDALNGLKFNIDGTADMTQVVSALMTAGMTAEQVATFLEELGYTNIELEVDNSIQGIENLGDIQNWDDVAGKIKISATNVNIPAARRASSFGSGGPVSGTKSGDEDGGGGNEWENPYDSFYNSAAALNKLLEKRNKLEQEYDEILQNEDSDIQDFVDNYEDRIKNYGEEIALQNQIITNRKKEQQDILNKNSDLKKYAWIDKEGKVQIDSKKIDKVKDEDLGQRIEDYIDSLETNTEEITKAEEAINDAEKAAEDLADEYQQTTADFERDLYDAIVYQREQEIEQMEGIADSLDQSAQDLVSAIQEEINERRQERDNKKTEEDIADKERRLAYLQQDTSGAYDQEILQLEKELGEQKEDYTDTLIDQKISEIEKQNDEAAKQREKQIQIAQYQLENDKNNGKIAEEAKNLLNGTSDVGKGNWNKIMDLLMAKDGFKTMTDNEKAIWEKETQTNFKKALTFLQSGGKENLATLLKEGKKQVTNNTYNYYGSQSEKKKTGSDGTSNKRKKVATTSQTPKYIAADAVPDHGIKRSEYTSRGGIVATVSSERGYGEYVRQKVKQEKIDGKLYYNFSGQYYDVMPLSSAKNEKGGFNVILKRGLPIFKKYKTGGLADFTGPAWLDGTKSKPELVLNQRDTQNFLQLKDILSSFMKNKTSITNNNNKTGDTIYEVSISVDKISNDYDVEEMASTIKRMISTDALHRNSNFVSRRI